MPSDCLSNRIIGHCCCRWFDRIVTIAVRNSIAWTGLGQDPETRRALQRAASPRWPTEVTQTHPRAACGHRSVTVKGVPPSWALAQLHTRLPLYCRRDADLRFPALLGRVHYSCAANHLDE